MKSRFSEHNSRKQRNELLDVCLGAVIVGYLKRENVKEIMVNPDGRLWVETLEEGKFVTSHECSPTQVKRIISIVASLNKKNTCQNNPVLSATLEKYKARFQGWLPPVTTKPAFCIRKQATVPLTLDDWVAQGSVTRAQAIFLRQCVLDKRNLVICGGTGSGKTTLANTLLQLIANTNERVILIEDTPELYIEAEDHVSLLTTANFTMRDCLAGTLRMRPDRIIIGEVRDGAALDLLKAWNTGHGGGITTLHANSAKGALQRLEDLVREVSSHKAHSLIAEVVNIIVYIHKTASGIPRLHMMMEVSGFRDGKYVIREV